MTYNIVLVHEKNIAKDIAKIPTHTSSKIFDAIEGLATSGLPHSQVKSLRNYETSNFRLRLGNYRVLFDIHIETNELRIHRILHRSKLY